MTPTLVRHHRYADSSASSTPVDTGTRARDWAEIQERMLAPLYDAVYERLEVGAATRMLSIGCGSGLALLIAASRGAHVTGVDTDGDRLALARERLLPDAGPGTGPGAGREDAPRRTDPRKRPQEPPREREPEREREWERARLADGVPTAVPAGEPPYNLITAFDPIGCAAGDSDGLAPTLVSAVPLASRGATVVLTGWGPPERCATAPVFRVAARLTEPARTPRPGGWRPALRDDLEEVAARAGLKPDGSGRVSCPFGYADIDSAVRGLVSTGLFDAAIRATDRPQVEKEVAEALHPHLRPDGTVWMPNVFRYLVCVA